MTQASQTTFLVGHSPGLSARELTTTPVWMQYDDARALRDCPDLAQNPILFSMSMDHPNAPFFGNAHLRFSGDLSFQTMRKVLETFQHIRNSSLGSDASTAQKKHPRMERMVRDAFSVVLQQPSLRILSYQPNRPAYAELEPAAFQAFLDSIHQACGTRPQQTVGGVSFPFAQIMLLRATESEREFFNAFSCMLARCAAYTVYHIHRAQNDGPLSVDLVRMGLSLGHVEPGVARHLGFTGFDAALNEILAQAIRIRALASRNLLNEENRALEPAWPPHVVLFAALLNDFAAFKNLSRHGVLRYSLKCYLTGETALFDNLLAYLGEGDFIALSRVTEDTDSITEFLKTTHAGRKISETADSFETFRDRAYEGLLPAIEVIAGTREP